MFGMGIGLLRSYATLWQSGYSWRDVLSRPPAPDAIETTMVKGPKGARAIQAPTAEEYGAHLPAVMQVHGDRVAILKLMSKLPSSERNLLPDVQQTADGLYARATARHAPCPGHKVDAKGWHRSRPHRGLSREPADQSGTVG